MNLRYSFFSFLSFMSIHDMAHMATILPFWELELWGVDAPGHFQIIRQQTISRNALRSQIIQACIIVAFTQAQYPGAKQALRVHIACPYLIQVNSKIPFLMAKQIYA